MQLTCCYLFAHNFFRNPNPTEDAGPTTRGGGVGAVNVKFTGFIGSLFEGESMNKKSLKIGITLIATIGLMGTMASADNFGGVACYKLSSSGTFWPYFGTIGNSHSTQTLTVLCPLSFDDPNGSPAVDIEVFDRNPSSNISCTVKWEKTNGSAINTLETTDVSSGSGSSVQVLNFGNVGFTSTNDDYIYATCDIPPVSGGNVSHVAVIKVHE